MTDFAAEHRLIDLSSVPPDPLRDRLTREFESRGTRLVLQIGAADLLSCVAIPEGTSSEAPSGRHPLQ